MVSLRLSFMIYNSYNIRVKKEEEEEDMIKQIYSCNQPFHNNVALIPRYTIHV